MTSAAMVCPRIMTGLLHVCAVKLQHSNLSLIMLVHGPSHLSLPLGGRGIVSISTSTQTPNHKTSKQKRHQHTTQWTSYKTGSFFFYYWFEQLQQLHWDLHYKEDSQLSAYLRITIYILLHTTKLTLCYLQRKKT